MITLTPAALSAVEKFIQGAAGPVAGLRLAISGGGCSGFQYGMSLEAAPAEDDVVVECGRIKLLVDPFSAPLPTEAEVDRVIQVVPEIVAQLRRLSPYWGEDGPAEAPFAPVYA